MFRLFADLAGGWRADDDDDRPRLIWADRSVAAPFFVLLEPEAVLARDDEDEDDDGGLLWAVARPETDVERVLDLLFEVFAALLAGWRADDDDDRPRLVWADRSVSAPFFLLLEPEAVLVRDDEDDGGDRGRLVLADRLVSTPFLQPEALDDDAGPDDDDVDDDNDDDDDD